MTLNATLVIAACIVLAAIACLGRWRDKCSRCGRTMDSLEPKHVGQDDELTCFACCRAGDARRIQEDAE